jgi:hypothetical protein
LASSRFFEPGVPIYEAIRQTFEDLGAALGHLGAQLCVLARLAARRSTALPAA